MLHSWFLFVILKRVKILCWQMISTVDWSNSRALLTDSCLRHVLKICESGQYQQHAGLDPLSLSLSSAQHHCCALRWYRYRNTVRQTASSQASCNRKGACPCANAVGGGRGGQPSYRAGSNLPSAVRLYASATGREGVDWSIEAAWRV